MQQTSAVTLSHTFLVDETPTAAGAVTVAVKRLDGTAVVPAGSATAGSPGVYTFPLPPQANLDTLTVDWSGNVGGAAVTVRDYVEIVGGFLFGIKEARDKPPALNATKYPAATIAATRIGVEQTCERICGQAWVPRFERVALSGNGTSRLATPRAKLRALRAVRVNGTDWTPAEVAAVGVSPSGVLVRSPRVSSGGAIWPVGVANVIVEYEHGSDMPTLEIRDAGIIHLRYWLTRTDSSVPYRAQSYTTPEGGVYRLTTPSKETTGIPDVDGAYLGNQLDLGGFA